MTMITAEFSNMVSVVMITSVMQMSIFSVMVLDLTAVPASVVQFVMFMLPGSNQPFREAVAYFPSVGNCVILNISHL